jgi:hypothetical protein
VSEHAQLRGWAVTAELWLSESQQHVHSGTTAAPPSSIKAEQQHLGGILYVRQLWAWPMSTPNPTCHERGDDSLLTLMLRSR